MEGTYKPNTISPSGNYEIIYGQTQEFGMGGPYASCFYLKPKDKAPFLIVEMCQSNAIFTDDETHIYFLHLNIERNIQVMVFEIKSNILKQIKDVYQNAEFENVNNYGHSVKGLIWDTKENKYYEGLAISDNNPENIQNQTIISPKIRIIPNHGIDLVTFNDSRETVNERLKGASSYPDRKIDFFTEFGFHIHYDDNDIVEFIEIMGDMHSTFELYKKNPFTTEINEMVAILNDKNNGEVNLIDAPEDYLYLELSLGIFRNSTPEEFIKYIKESKLENPDDFINGTLEWMLEDLEKTNHFQTIGLGNKDYFRNPIYF